MSWELLLAAGARIVKALSMLDLSRQIDRVKIDQALQTLKEIFFYPSELVSILGDIEAGKRVDPDLVEYFEEEFVHIPPRVQEALRYITIENFEERNVLRLDDLELMREIAAGKVNTRRAINRFFREYRESARRRNNQFSEEATRVLGQIERLNTQMKNFEDRLLAARDPASVRNSRTTKARVKARQH